MSNCIVGWDYRAIFLSLYVMSDVDIFTACLKELLLGSDNVFVPGLGVFMTRLMPASFSDRGRTINPPYRKLYFRASDVGDASQFAGQLAGMLPEGSDAGQWLESFLLTLREELDKTKHFEIAGLGQMRATAQNDYFFVADDSLDIFPEGMGLNSVTVLPGFRQPFEDDLLELQDLSETEPGIELEPEPGTETVTGTVDGTAAEAGAEPAPAPATEVRRSHKWWWITLIVVAALLAFLLLSAKFSDSLPWGGAVDSIMNHLLYSKEERSILNI